MKLTKRKTAAGCILLIGWAAVGLLHGDEVIRNDGWIIEEIQINDSTTNRHTFELDLHPQPQPKPALKHRLTPDRFDRIDGNASIYYLKAMGFFEETAARQALERFESQAREKATESNADDWPPYIWLNLPPQDYPIDEVHQFLAYLTFQPPLLKEAARRRSFNLDRDIRNTEDPIASLLPEIQVMRQLARYQVLRTRLAIAEGRINDAIEAIGQQYSLANHLGSDEFFVSNLVGAAIAGMTWNDVAHLLKHSDTPNLYWAFASLPKPLIDMKEAASFERQFLFEQVKCLREVTEEVRPIGYWQDFLGRFERQIGPIMQFEAGMRLSSDPSTTRTATAFLFAAAYPGAKKFLAEELGMEAGQIDAYPRIQAVLLAMKRYYEIARDDQFKWDFVPFAQATAPHAMPALSEQLEQDEKKYGLVTKPAGLLLPALAAIRHAQQRIEQHIAMAQTIESVRHHLAANDGEMPVSLDKLHLPAPIDPISGKPFSYIRKGDSAILTGEPTSYIQYRFVLRPAR